MAAGTSDAGAGAGMGKARSWTVVPSPRWRPLLSPQASTVPSSRRRARGVAAPSPRPRRCPRAGRGRPPPAREGGDGGGRRPSTQRLGVAEEAQLHTDELVGGRCPGVGGDEDGAGPLLGGGPGSVLGGPVLDGATIQRLCCDAGVHRVVRSGRSAVLDYGTTTRTVPAPLWSALVVRDQHCRFPGCDRPSAWAEAHHVVHRAQGRFHPPRKPGADVRPPSPSLSPTGVVGAPRARCRGGGHPARRAHRAKPAPAGGRRQVPLVAA